MSEDYEEIDLQPVKLHVPKWVMALIGLIVILEVISWLQFPRTVRDYKVYRQAQSRIDNSETSAALNELLEVAQRHPSSIPIMVELVELSMKNGYYDIAGYVIDSYISGKSLKDEEYNRVDRHYIKLENYYGSLTAVEGIIEAAPKQDTVGEEYYSYIKTHVEELLYQDGQDDAYLCYTLAMLSQDSQEAGEYLQTCYEIDPECFDVRAQLGIVYRRLGRLEEARKMIQEALRKDKADSSALRAMATLAMAEGDVKTGLQSAREAYLIYPDGTYIRETYLIALTVNGMQEEAQKIRSEMESGKGDLEPDTLQLLEGKITLKDYYIGE